MCLIQSSCYLFSLRGLNLICLSNFHFITQNDSKKQSSTRSKKGPQPSRQPGDSTNPHRKQDPPTWKDVPACKEVSPTKGTKPSKDVSQNKDLPSRIDLPTYSFSEEWRILASGFLEGDASKGFPRSAQLGGNLEVSYGSATNFKCPRCAIHYQWRITVTIRQPLRWGWPRSRVPLTHCSRLLEFLIILKSGSGTSKKTRL